MHKNIHTMNLLSRQGLAAMTAAVGRAQTNSRSLAGEIKIIPLKTQQKQQQKVCPLIKQMIHISITTRAQPFTYISACRMSVWASTSLSRFWSIWVWSRGGNWSQWELLKESTGRGQLRSLNILQESHFFVGLFSHPWSQPNVSLRLNCGWGEDHHVYCESKTHPALGDAFFPHDSLVSWAVLAAAAWIEALFELPRERWGSAGSSDQQQLNGDPVITRMLRLVAPAARCQCILCALRTVLD